MMMAFTGELSKDLNKGRVPLGKAIKVGGLAPLRKAFAASQSGGDDCDEYTE